MGHRRQATLRHSLRHRDRQQCLEGYAEVVFLFDEFFLPRRIAAATVQGLRGHKANEGALALMKTVNSKAEAVDLIGEGHRLRWTKQMALRGRGRSYDQHGRCGKQRLVISSDLKSFMANAARLFPRASIRTAGVYSKATRVALLIQILSKPDLPTKLTTKDISRLMEAETGKRVPWRTVSSVCRQNISDIRFDILRECLAHLV